MKPEPKPVREWLEELPEPYRAAAIRNCDDWAAGMKVFDLLGAVSNAFLWRKTPEGFGFWGGVCNAILSGSPLPPYPGPAGESPYDRAAKEAAERWAKRDQQQQARIHQLERLAEKRGKELEMVREAGKSLFAALAHLKAKDWFKGERQAYNEIEIVDCRKVRAGIEQWEALAPSTEGGGE